MLLDKPGGVAEPSSPRLEMFLVRSQLTSLREALTQPIVQLPDFDRFLLLLLLPPDPPPQVFDISRSQG